MCERVAGIRIKGGYFNEPCTINDPNKRNYFNNLMYHLVLNDESHLQE